MYQRKAEKGYEERKNNKTQAKLSLANEQGNEERIDMYTFDFKQNLPGTHFYTQ